MEDLEKKIETEEEKTEGKIAGEPQPEEKVDVLEKVEETAPEADKVEAEENVEDKVAEQVSLSTTPVPTEEEVHDAETIAAPETAPESEPVSEPVTDLGTEPEPVEEEAKFTQSQVNDLVGKTRQETRNRTFEYIYGRYGVNDEEGLDNLVGNAQRFDSLNEEFNVERDGWKKERAAWDSERETRDIELRELAEKVALMESGIDRERYDDAKFILKGKGLEVTAENIANELNSHPEWKKEEKVYTPKEPSSKISVLGNEKIPEHGNSEEDDAMKLFKI